MYNLNPEEKTKYSDHMKREALSNTRNPLKISKSKYFIIYS